MVWKESPADGKKFIGPNRPTPLTYVHSIASKEADEVFDPFNRENRPGDRLVDEYMHKTVFVPKHTRGILDNGRGGGTWGTYWDPEGTECDGRIMFTLEHPKKGTKKFDAWMSADFKPRYFDCMSNKRNICIFSDGSQQDREGGLVSGAAWTIVQPHNYGPAAIVKEGKVGGGKRTPYDCEMLAISKGLQDIIPLITEDHDTLVVFADNESAVRKSMRPGNGPSSLEAIRSCTSVRKILKQFPQLVINFCWFPAHLKDGGGFGGVTNFNDHVDEKAKEALEEPQPAYVSLAMAKQRLMARAKKQWTESTLKPKYIGKHYLHTAGSNTSKYTEIKVGKHGFLSKHGEQQNFKSAKLVRFLTGHFPHGEFRSRFNLEGPVNCACGGGVETREHILLRCPLWIRWWEHHPDAALPGNGANKLADHGVPHALQFGNKDDYDAEGHEIITLQNISMDDVEQFLAENWLAGTFEFTHLTTAVNEVKTSREGRAGFSYDECMKVPTGQN